MTEPLFVRARRLMSARAEDRLDRMEAANPLAIMRESIREMERALDDVRDHHAKAAAGRIHAERMEKAALEEAESLGLKARYALEQQREDLARRALELQMSAEASAAHYKDAATRADEDSSKWQQAAADLKAQRDEMKLAMDDMAKLLSQPAPLGQDGVADVRASVDSRVAERVARAQSAFERVSGLAVPPQSGTAEQVDAVAEIDALARDAEIAERLKDMQAAGKAGGNSPAA